jgi:hypothetical protein
LSTRRMNRRVLIVLALAVVLLGAALGAAPAPTPPLPSALQTAIAVVQAATARAQPSPAAGGTQSGELLGRAPAAVATSAPVTPTLALEGPWQAFGPLSDQAIMERTTVKPDPKRPWVKAALVRFDMARIELHIVPGWSEPAAAAGVKPFPRPGKIPAEDQAAGRLLAGFNGGFKTRHGAYGMMVDGITIVPPRDNMATVAIGPDHSIEIGAWGREITATRPISEYRQNCPLLVDQGAVNPAVNNGDPADWGYTVKNSATTWRSALGLTQDRRWLIYGIGDPLTVETLAQSMQAAGAYYAMELDVNFAWTRFVTFQTAAAVDAPHPVVAEKLLSAMLGKDDEFLAPYPRDFFYVTLAQSTPGK